MVDPTTKRAEEIRETTGMAWEFACLQAERERDEDTSEDPCDDHGYDVCPDCGNGGVKIGRHGYESCTRFLTCWSDPEPFEAPRSDLGEWIELRMLGQYVKLTRAAWLDLLDDLKPDCELAQRIRARIAS